MAVNIQAHKGKTKNQLQIAVCKTIFLSLSCISISKHSGAGVRRRRRKEKEGEEDEICYKYLLVQKRKAKEQQQRKSQKQRESKTNKRTKRLLSTKSNKSNRIYDILHDIQSQTSSVTPLSDDIMLTTPKDNSTVNRVTVQRISNINDQTKRKLTDASLVGLTSSSRSPLTISSSLPKNVVQPESTIRQNVAMPVTVRRLSRGPSQTTAVIHLKSVPSEPAIPSSAPASTVSVRTLPRRPPQATIAIHRSTIPQVKSDKNKPTRRLETSKSVRQAPAMRPSIAASVSVRKIPQRLSEPTVATYRSTVVPSKFANDKSQEDETPDKADKSGVCVYRVSRRSSTVKPAIPQKVSRASSTISERSGSLSSDTSLPRPRPASAARPRSNGAKVVKVTRQKRPSN
ncbi:unnamed protein product [Didymodactylos carnosus]|uniref:Uncharacterized protein n=1 Tax=Didymodactylos carnosus TaxID=1234261 RepID=A0A815X9W9_9BILA|nr:unnamed protein product [Didymodactylos carnosus]CAF4416034.1 unnamed protein product [Didymodactylos carnosus]